MKTSFHYNVSRSAQENMFQHGCIFKVSEMFCCLDFLETEKENVM